ncbi:gephyrin-like molybdotransferase receptor GlpR [Actinomycetes bacterium KLBMP 9759]
MPSSMIFAGLVVLWLLILVPAVARHRQEVARPSVAALSGRVLERPTRRQNQEVDAMDDAEREPEPVDDEHDEQTTPETPVEETDDPDDRRWERPPPRYRPGRGGYDPAAAEAAARARYAFRQRVVLTMLIAAVGTAITAAVALPDIWWIHVTIDIALVGYLIYLRRQVRLEEAIRERRASRMAGTRRPSAADDPELDEWARRGREATRQPVTDTTPEIDDVAPTPEPVTDTAEPPLTDDEPDNAEPALPRLQPAPPPPLPAGTALVEGLTDDPDLYDLDGPTRPDYRRAAGE